MGRLSEFRKRKNRYALHFAPPPKDSTPAHAVRVRGPIHTGRKGFGDLQPDMPDWYRRAILPWDTDRIMTPHQMGHRYRYPQWGKVKDAWSKKGGKA